MPRDIKDVVSISSPFYVPVEFEETLSDDQLSSAETSFESESAHESKTSQLLNSGYKDGVCCKKYYLSL